MRATYLTILLAPLAMQSQATFSSRSDETVADALFTSKTAEQLDKGFDLFGLLK